MHRRTPSVAIFEIEVGEDLAAGVLDMETLVVLDHRPWRREMARRQSYPRSRLSGPTESPCAAQALAIILMHNGPRLWTPRAVFRTSPCGRGFGQRRASRVGKPVRRLPSRNRAFPVTALWGHLFARWSTYEARNHGDNWDCSRSRIVPHQRLVRCAQAH